MELSSLKLEIAAYFQRIEQLHIPIFDALDLPPRDQPYI